MMKLKNYLFAATSVRATVVVPNGQKEQFTERFNNYMAEARQQYAQTDPDMTYAVEAAQASDCMKAAETGILLKGLSGAPQGVIECSTEVAGMFETSNNVGVVGMDDGTCTVNEHVEISSIDHAWTYLLELLRKI